MGRKRGIPRGAEEIPEEDEEVESMLGAVEPELESRDVSESRLEREREWSGVSGYWKKPVLECEEKDEVVE